MGIKVRNNAYGSVVVGINPGDTVITLGAGEGARFPTLISGDYFYGTLIDVDNNLEIVRVTARAVDTMTVVRGRDNTIARSYPSGSRFELRPTAAMFEDLTKAENTSYDPTVAGTGQFTVQDALDNLDGRLDAAEIAVAGVPGAAEAYTDAQITALAAGTPPAPKISGTAMQKRLALDLGAYSVYGEVKKPGVLTVRARRQTDEGGTSDTNTPRTYTKARKSPDVVGAEVRITQTGPQELRITSTINDGVLKPLGNIASSAEIQRSRYLAAVDNTGFVYVGTYGSPAHAVRKYDYLGVEEWNFPTANDPVAIALRPEDDGVIFGSQTGVVTRLDQTGGSPTSVWSVTPHSGWVYAVVLGKNGEVFTSSNDNTVKRLDPDTGATIWTYAAGTDVYSIATGPDNTLVAICAASPFLRKLNMATGGTVWTQVAAAAVGIAVDLGGIITTYTTGPVGNTDLVRSYSPTGGLIGTKSYPIRVDYITSSITYSSKDAPFGLELGVYPYHWDEDIPV